MTSSKDKQQEIVKKFLEKFNVGKLQYPIESNQLKEVLSDTHRGELKAFVIASQGEYLFALRESFYVDNLQRRHIVIRGSEINPFSKKEHDDQGYCRFIIDKIARKAYMGTNPDQIDIMSGVYSNMGVGSAMLVLALEETYRKRIQNFIIFHLNAMSYPFYEQFGFKKDSKRNFIIYNTFDLFATDINETIRRKGRISKIMENRNITIIDI